LAEALLVQGKVNNITKQLELIDEIVENVETLLDLPRLIRAIEHLLSRESGGSDDDDGHHIFGKKDELERPIS